ncbi:hypothetical protein [Aquabacterium sp.]|uniref:hypothetical protein n=1 Tax=Aquabacterium sp. TaxID=1872578 RepID=UPI0035B08641
MMSLSVMVFSGALCGTACSTAMSGDRQLAHIELKSKQNGPLAVLAGRDAYVQTGMNDAINQPSAPMRQ